MRGKRSLTGLLLCLVLGVWGLVAYQVYGTLTASPDDSEKIPPIEPGAAGPHPPFVYKADVRDPFHFALSARPDSSRLRPPLPPREVWAPPALKLKGILFDRVRKRTAVLEKSDGSVFFLAEGDTLIGTKILKVGKDEVSYVFNKKRAEWTLEGQ